MPIEDVSFFQRPCGKRGVIMQYTEDGSQSPCQLLCVPMFKGGWMVMVLSQAIQYTSTTYMPRPTPSLLLFCSSSK